MKRLLFVDDEQRVLQGIQRQLRGMRQEWEMTFLDSGSKALQFLAANPIDVIVSDMMMPGMDGAQLLTQVMKVYPDTVRLVLSGNSDREAILRLVGPSHQYLSKPCHVEDLRAAILRSLATRDVLTNARLKQLVSRLPSLPTLPALHARLTEELLVDNPSLSRISEIISRDIGMTSKILQLVNSAFFGLAQPASNIADAVSYLGINTLHALVLSHQVFSQFDSSAIRGFSIEALEDHCWTVGVFARRIATHQQCSQLLQDQCFLAGMLHDTGFLILASGEPELFEKILNEARQCQRPVWQVELARMETTHAELGAYLLGLWGLPSMVVEAVALHHRPTPSCCNSFSPLVAVYVADFYAHKYTPSCPEVHNDQLDFDWLQNVGARDCLSHWESLCQRAPVMA